MPMSINHEEVLYKFRLIDPVLQHLSVPSSRYLFLHCSFRRSSWSCYLLIFNFRNQGLLLVVCCLQFIVVYIHL